MIDIINQEHFDQVIQFAQVTNQMKSLQETLDYLSNYACDEDNPSKTKCLLGKDFAPYSFAFTMQKLNKQTQEYEYWFNGGAIFHGNHDNGGDGSMPTLSVCLSSSQGWSIHT